ncbi:hypothetical protein C8F04DRAFT_1253885 [Mycena alexandri]|uniref:CCHC-type domain-containing protein n=1 Tax=Mycena alexandri TaxID=1745969 RepID=A0AAD6XA77_9AGAR|nr:hypothetical protein C8F04DRAFT_1253885 [Mycena alexandri]
MNLGGIVKLQKLVYLKPAPSEIQTSVAIIKYFKNWPMIGPQTMLNAVADGWPKIYGVEQAAAGRSGNRSGPPDNTGDRTGKVSGKQKEKQKGGNNTKPPGNSTAPPPYSNSGNRPGAGGKGGQANKQAGPSKPYADKLGADGKIKEAERERRRKNNLCMYCGGQGHSAEDCKKRPEKASGRSAQAGTPPQGDASTPESSKN